MKQINEQTITTMNKQTKEQTSEQMDANTNRWMKQIGQET